MKRRKAMSLLSIGIITKQLPTQVVSSVLTEREREVLALVARGYTNKQIAEALYVTEKTARNHVSHILEKLELSRRSEAAAFAVEHRLVPPRMLQ
jgi:two-component system, NarL family, response regulator DevR